MTPQVSREALSLQEAARLLGVHEDTLKNWARRGVLEMFRCGPRLWRVPKSEIQRLRNAKQRQTTPNH